jgi:6-phosphogluconolactonase
MTTGGLACNTTGNTSTLAITPDKTFLYVVDLCLSSIHVYSLNPPGVKMSEIGPSPFYIVASQGVPDSLAIDASGSFLYAVSPIGLSSQILEFAINGTTGALSYVSTVTESADLRTMVTDPTGKFAFVNDVTLGRIFAYEIGANGLLSAVSGSPFTVPGNGQPSRLVMGGNGNFLYTLLISGGIAAWSINGATGALTVVPGSPFPISSSAVALGVDPLGKFLYASVGNTIQGFNINASTGGLTGIAGSPFSTPATSFSIALDSAGTFLYASPFANSAATSSIPGFKMDSTTGSLTPLSGSPFPATPFVVGIISLSIP